MNALAQSDIKNESGPLIGSENLNSLVVELEHYRKQSEWLSCVNDLHGRLAGAVDLTAMIEAFSIWLMPHVNHDLIGYQNPEREKIHMFCSCHGPERREVVDAAGKIFQDWPERGQAEHLHEGNYYVHNWEIQDSKGSVLLVVLRKDSDFSDYESHLVDKGLELLREPLLHLHKHEIRIREFPFHNSYVHDPH